MAQALTSRADLLLLDEPTTGLDRTIANRIRTIMRAEANRGAAVVCVSHDPQVLSDADRIVYLAEGRIVSAGAARGRSEVQ